MDFTFLISLVIFITELKISFHFLSSWIIHLNGVLSRSKFWSELMDDFGRVMLELFSNFFFQIWLFFTLSFPSSQSRIFISLSLSSQHSFTIIPSLRNLLDHLIISNLTPSRMLFTIEFFSLFRKTSFVCEGCFLSWPFVRGLVSLRAIIDIFFFFFLPTLNV